MVVAKTFSFRVVRTTDQSLNDGTLALTFPSDRMLGSGKPDPGSLGLSLSESKGVVGRRLDTIDYFLSSNLSLLGPGSERELHRDRPPSSALNLLARLGEGESQRPTRPGLTLIRTRFRSYKKLRFFLHGGRHIVRDARFHVLSSRDTPTIESKGAMVRVLSGCIDETPGPINTLSPVVLAHISLSPQARYVLTLPLCNCRYEILVLAGRVTCIGKDKLTVTQGHSAQLLEALSRITLHNPSYSACELVFFGRAC